MHRSWSSVEYANLVQSFYSARTILFFLYSSCMLLLGGAVIVVAFLVKTVAKIK